MTRFIVTTGCIAALLASTSVPSAQGRGQGGPKVKPTTGVSAKGGGSHGGGPKATGPRTAAQGGGKSQAPKAKPATPSVAAGGGAGTTTTPKKEKTGRKDRTTTATADTLTPVQQKLQHNSNLANKLEARLAGKLPAGMTLMEAAEGFSNLGKFVSAANASSNHDLDFVKLKAAILDGQSLGQAMKEQRTTLGSVEAGRAETEAATLIRATETEPQSASPTTSTTSTTTSTKAKPRASKGTR